MATRKYRILFADDVNKLEALLAESQYADWTFFKTLLPFSELEADHNFPVTPPDQDCLSIKGPGVFTVGFAP